MTTIEFIGALPKDGWTVNHIGMIRRIVQVGDNTISCCPITSINNNFALFYMKEAAILGIDQALRDDIVSAADNMLTRPNLYDLRQKLLRALNLI